MEGIQLGIPVTLQGLIDGEVELVFKRLREAVRTDALKTMQAKLSDRFVVIQLSVRYGCNFGN